MYKKMNQRQGESKEKPRSDSPEQQAVLNVLCTSVQFSNQFDRLFREHGLTHFQYNLLQILQREGKPMSNQEIAHWMGQSQAAMTGILNRLEERGLITRKRSPDDARIMYSEPTKATREVLMGVDVPVRELYKQLIGRLNQEELKVLNRLLEKVC